MLLISSEIEKEIQKIKIKANPYRNKWVTKMCTTLFQKCHNLMVCVVVRMMKLRDKHILERVVPYTCQMSV
jgi:hypothetical protein